MDFEEMAMSIDNLSHQERKFVLYYIIKNYYIPDIEEELIPMNDCKTEGDYYTQTKLREHIKTLAEIRDVLTFDIF